MSDEHDNPYRITTARLANHHPVVRCTTHGRTLMGGLGPFAVGMMWCPTTEGQWGEVPEGCDVADDFGSTCQGHIPFDDQVKRTIEVAMTEYRHLTEAPPVNEEETT